MARSSVYRSVYDAFRKSHEVVGSQGAVTYPPIWETADYGWSAFTPNNVAILRSPTTGEPVMYNGVYWMAYDAVTTGIGMAYSTDLVNWTDAAGNPIITPGDAEAESWEKERITVNDLIYMGAEAGHEYDFWLFYKGSDLGITHVAIGIIKSNDMASWVRDTAHNPIANWVAGWIAGCNGIEDFRVQKTSTGSWMAIYEANTAPTAGASVGAASSSDTLPHSGWGDEGQVCSVTFGGDFIANPTVIRRGGTYYCYYERSLLGTAVTYGMYAAEAAIFTLDAWTQMTNPVLSPTIAWEGTSTIPNGLIWANAEFYVYFTGNTGGAKAIGLATGVGNGLTRYPDYAGDETDYQIRIIAHYGAGVDSGEDVYLGERCRTDFGDVRFTSDDGVTQLDYWIQIQVDGDYAIIWIKVPSLPSYPAETTIYIYYGRADATTTESGADTWIDYDDWERYAVNAVLPLGEFVVGFAEEVMRVSDNRAYKGSKSLFMDDDSPANRNRADWDYANKTTGGYRTLIALYMDNGYGTDDAWGIHVRTPVTNIISLDVDGALNIRDYHTGAWQDTGKDFSEDAWHVLELCVVIDAATWDFRFDDGWVLDRPIRTASDELDHTRLWGSSAGGQFLGNYGVCCIGKYVDPEPTPGAWGNERPVRWPF